MVSLVLAHNGVDERPTVSLGNAMSGLRSVLPATEVCCLRGRHRSDVKRAHLALL